MTIENGILSPKITDPPEATEISVCACNEPVMDYEEAFVTYDGFILHDDVFCKAQHVDRGGRKT